MRPDLAWPCVAQRMNPDDDHFRISHDLDTSLEGGNTMRLKMLLMMAFVAWVALAVVSGIAQA